MSDGDAASPSQHVDAGDRLGPASFVFLAIASLSLIADGFDISAMGFVAPELIKHWHVAAADLVPVFSAGIFGLLVGAPVLGYAGDRFGRKKVIVGGLTSFGLFTLMTIFASNLTEFVALRFLTGLGLGGLIPNITALAAEVAPKRLRGTFIIIVTFGVPIGLALPGWVTAAFVPAYGWPVLMVVGGVLPLVIAGCGWILLKESAAFERQRGLRVGHAPSPEPLLHAQPAQAAAPARVSLRHLFTNGLAFVTPVVWVALAANQFTNFFTLSWLPTLLQTSGLSTSEAGLTASMYSVGGLAGGVVLTFIVDRFGALPLVVLFLLGAPMVALIGTPHLSPLVLAATIAGAGFCVSGNNFGFNAVIAMVYPAGVRSTGIGWAQAFGRLGSLAAQSAGGLLLARHLSMQTTYFAPASALLIGAAAAGLLLLICVRRYGSYRLDEPLAVASPSRGQAAAGQPPLVTPHAPRIVGEI